MNDKREICVHTETIPGFLNCFWLYGVLPLAGMHSLDQVNHSDLLQHDFQQSDLHSLTKTRLPWFYKAMETIPGFLNCFWLYGVLPLAGMHSLDQVNHSDLLQHDFQQTDLHRLTKTRLPWFSKAMTRLRYREYTKINFVHCCVQFLYLRRTVQYISPCRWIVRQKKCYRRGCPYGDS